MYGRFTVSVSNNRSSSRIDSTMIPSSVFSTAMTPYSISPAAAACTIAACVFNGTSRNPASPSTLPVKCAANRRAAV